MVSVDLSFKTWVKELFFEGREKPSALVPGTFRKISPFPCAFLGFSLFFPVSAVEIRPWQLDFSRPVLPKISKVTPSAPTRVEPKASVFRLESLGNSLVCPEPLILSSEALHSLPQENKPRSKNQKTAKDLLKESKDYAKIIHHFEAKYNMPPGLLSAIAWVESRGQLWAINNLVSSRYCRTQEEAIVYVKQLERTSQPSISVGCMQINWHVHKDQFRSLNEALTPYYNIKFAAKLLTSLRKRFGSWEKAIGWYNPKGNKPNQEYIDLVCRRLTKQQVRA